MIDQKYRDASQKVDDALNNAQSLVIAAWTIAVEIDSSNNRHNNTLLSLLTMAEDVLEGGMKAQDEVWEVVKEQAA